MGRACVVALLIGCASPSPEQQLDDLLPRAADCGYPRPDPAPPPDAVVTCLNQALAAKALARATWSDIAGSQGCDYQWWFITDGGRVRMFHTNYGYGCTLEGILEDPSCAGPFVVDTSY